MTETGTTADVTGPTAGRERRRHSALLVQCLVYVAFAMPLGMLGAGWPGVRHELHRSSGSLGLVALAYGIGRLCTAPTAETLLRRWHIRHLTTVLLVGLGASSAAIAWTRSFPALVMAAAAAGVLSGGLDSLGAHFQTVVRDVGRAGLMFGAYGIGATVGPALVSLTSWTVAFSTAAAVSVLTAALAFAPDVRWPHRFAERAAPRGGRAAVTVSVGAVALLLAVFGIYCGIEMVTGSWAATYLRDHRHTSDRVAGLAMSGFWAGLTLGRMALGAVKVSADRLLLGAGVGVIVAYGSLATLPTPLAIAGLVLGGFTLAAMFPALMSTTADRVGVAAAGRVAGWELLAANLAETGFAAVTGVLVSRLGSGAPAVLMAVLAVAGLPVLAGSIRRHAQADGHAPAATPSPPPSTDAGAGAGR